jgi:hypothetical protein
MISGLSRIIDQISNGGSPSGHGHGLNSHSGLFQSCSIELPPNAAWRSSPHLGIWNVRMLDGWGEAVNKQRNIQRTIVI